jgi:hypothetical protein
LCFLRRLDPIFQTRLRRALIVISASIEFPN